MGTENQVHSPSMIVPIVFQAVGSGAGDKEDTALKKLMVWSYSSANYAPGSFPFLLSLILTLETWRGWGSLSSDAVPLKLWEAMLFNYF